MTKDFDNGPTNTMEQYIGDGASLFITIVACIIGFAAAAGKLDQMKTEEENPKDEE